MALRINHTFKDGRVLYHVKRVTGLDWISVYETTSFNEARAFVLGWNEAYSAMSRDAAKSVKQVIACEP